MNIGEILKNIPDYKVFHTVEEMNRRTLHLAKEYPEVVKVEQVGTSRAGSPIYCLVIGHGSKNALMYGCPHPNEPIGTMMLDFFTQELARNNELRDSLDYTWYIIKSSDPDGTKLNENWFNNPSSITSYMKNFYRPPFVEQVEWSFPIEYKTLKFDNPIPETRVIMNLIDEKKPEFIYALHNAGFGGCMWYLTDGNEALFKKLHAICENEDFPLHLGELEVPYVTPLSTAIFKMPTVRDNYDFMEKFGGDEDPTSKIVMGDCCSGYANRDGNIRSHVLVSRTLKTHF